jgi:hypothetical protein
LEPRIALWWTSFLPVIGSLPIGRMTRQRWFPQDSITRHQAALRLALRALWRFAGVLVAAGSGAAPGSVGGAGKRDG